MEGVKMDINGRMNTIVETGYGTWLIVDDDGIPWCADDLSLDYAIIRLIDCHAYYVAIEMDREAVR